MRTYFLFFLQTSALEQEFVSQLKWLATLSLLLWGMVLFYLFFRLKAPSTHKIKPYEAYLAYYVYPYPELHSEIIQQSEIFRKNLMLLISTPKISPTPSFLQALLLELAWLEGQIYRFHQPHLRLWQEIQSLKNEVSPNSFEETLQLQMAQARLFFEKRNILFQFLTEKGQTEDFQKNFLSVWPIPPEKPFPEVFYADLPPTLKELFSELLQIQKDLKLCIHQQTYMGEWIVMQDGSSQILEKNGLQCFHCVVKDFHTLAESALCHPFSLETLLPEQTQTPVKI